jgi:Leucine-rich repeat (LRR) protein
MNVLAIVAVLLIAVVGVWWVGSNSITTEIGEGNVSMPVVEESETETMPPQAVPTPDTPTPTVDPGTGKSITVYEGISVSEGTTILNLSDKGLSGSLKAEVRFLANLKQLNLSGNNFTSLPAEVGQLSKLEILNLSDNPFTGLPLELSNLKNLKVLDLRGTQYAKQDLETIKKGLPVSTQILVD